MKFFLLILFLAAFVLPIQAKTTYTYDKNGYRTGRSETSTDGTTKYYDSNGYYLGRSTTDKSGNTRYYDKNGYNAGRAKGSENPALDPYGRSRNQR